MKQSTKEIHFCDVCGKEIPEDFVVNLERVREKALLRYFDVRDICSYCYLAATDPGTERDIKRLIARKGQEPKVPKLIAEEVKMADGTHRIKVWDIRDAVTAKYLPKEYLQGAHWECFDTGSEKWITYYAPTEKTAECIALWNITAGQYYAPDIFHARISELSESTRRLPAIRQREAERKEFGLGEFSIEL